MLRISNGRGPRPAGGGFETFSWYYFRISGIALIFLAFTHMYVMHIGTDVACTTYAFVAERYANVFWRVFDWLLLTFGLTHGINGLRVIIEDYVRSSSWRFWLLAATGVLLLVFFMLGTITLVTFQPITNVGPMCVGTHE